MDLDTTPIDAPSPSLPLPSSSLNGSLDNGPSSLHDDSPLLDTPSAQLSAEHGDGILSPPLLNAKDPALNIGSEPLQVAHPDIGSGWIAADSAPVSLPAPSQAQQSWATSKRHTFFIVRVPRSVDETLRNEIKLAESRLDQAVKKRDSHRLAIQEKKTQKAELLEKLKPVREKQRACWAAIQGKNTELEPILMALGKFKNAQGNARGRGHDICSSEGELNERISELDYRIQHESLSLKEEKQLMREIKQLESTRSQVCANSMLQQELTECLGPKEEIQDQYKFLSQDINEIKKEHVKLCAECDDIEKELNKLNKEIEDLRELCDKANTLQSDAFGALRELKKQESSKNDMFFQNKRDLQASKELAVQRKWEDVRDFCTNNMEAFMAIWNSDDNFRADYVRNNERSCIRRLETLDGRLLGPGERPPQINDMNHLKPNPGDAQVKASKTPGISAVQTSKIDGSPLDKVKKISPEPSKEKTEVFSAKGNQASKTSNTSVQVSEADSLPPKKDLQGKKSSHEGTREVSDGKENHNSRQNEVIVELLDSETHDIEIKERLKQEQIAKAKEAEERKKRRAEKSELKAQARVKKEAERKEKEKERKAQKKAAAATNVETAEGLEPQEEGTMEKPALLDLEERSKKDAIPAADTINLSSRGQKVSGVVRRKIASKQLRGPKPPLPSRLSKKSAFPIPFWVSMAVVAVILLLLAIFFFLRL